MEAAQPFLVRSMADLLRILQEHPEWRAQLQGVLLSQRLLELPDRFDAFVERDYAATRVLLEQTSRHLEATSARLDRIAEQLAVLTERLTQLTQRVDDLTQRMERVEAQIEALTQRVNDLTVRMERVEAQIEALTQRMERVEAQIEALTQRVNDLTVRMERVEAQIEALTQRMERVEAQIEALTQRVNDLTVRMERVEAQIEALTQRVNDLTVRMERVEATLKKHGDELSRIKGIVMELRFEKGAIPLLRRDFRRVRVLSTQEWSDLLDEAEEAAILTLEEIEEVSRLDGVVEAYRRADRQPVVIAVEVSAVGDRHDVERAARRADLLSRLFSWKRQQLCSGVAAVVAETFTAGAIESARSSETLLLSFRLE